MSFFYRKEFICYCFINLCASIAYVNGFLNRFARKATHCVHISTAFRVKGLMRSKRLMCTRYGLARKATYALEATYAYKVQLLRVERLMLQGLT